MSGTNLISGPFGTGTVMFFNDLENDTTAGVRTGTIGTALQVPDDGNAYTVANEIIFGEITPAGFNLDSVTIQVGPTNPDTSLTLTGNTQGTVRGTAAIDQDGPRHAEPRHSIQCECRSQLPVHGGVQLRQHHPPITIGSLTVNSPVPWPERVGELPRSEHHAQRRLDARSSTTRGLSLTTRISDGIGPLPTLTFNGGTFDYLGAPGTAATEAMGPIQLNGGAATIESTPGTGGGTVVLISAGLNAKHGGDDQFRRREYTVHAGRCRARTRPTSSSSRRRPPSTPTNDAGTISSIVVTNGGVGYTSVPAVTLSGGGGTYASATATMLDGVVTGVTVTGATGYGSLPDVTIAPPVSPAAATAAIDPLGTVTEIDIASGGSGYTTVPEVFLSGGNSAIPATAVATLTAGVVTAITITNPGAGYTSPPTVTISARAVTATATASIGSNGQLSSITVNSGGAGYTTVPAVTLIGGGFTTPATATAEITNGVVTAIDITDPGSGYTTVPTVQIAPRPAALATAEAELANPDGFLPFATVTGVTPTAFDFATYYTGDNGSVGIGAYTGYASSIAAAKAVKVASATATRTGDMITAIRVTALGTGYTTVPNVTLVGGGATIPATAVATVVGGGVTAITIVNGGTGYTSTPTVVIDPPLADVVKETKTTDSVGPPARRSPGCCWPRRRSRRSRSMAR